MDENGKIIDAKFKTFGCGSAIASSSLATEWIKGKQVREKVFSFVTSMLMRFQMSEAATIKNQQIAAELSLPPVKLHCSSKLF